MQEIISLKVRYYFSYRVQMQINIKCLLLGKHNTSRNYMAYNRRAERRASYAHQKYAHKGARAALAIDGYTRLDLV